MFLESKRKRRIVVNYPDDATPILSLIQGASSTNAQEIEIQDDVKDNANGEPTMPTLGMAEPMPSVSRKRGIQQGGKRGDDPNDQPTSTEKSSVKPNSSRKRGKSNAAKINCPGCSESLVKASLLRYLKKTCVPARNARKQIIINNRTLNKLICEYENCGFIPENMAQHWEHQIPHPPNSGVTCGNIRCQKMFIESLNLLDHYRWYTRCSPLIPEPERPEPYVRLVDFRKK